MAPVCDGALAEGGELCDGADLMGADCIDFGFTGGTLTCNGTCDGFDVSSCTGAGCGR